MPIQRCTVNGKMGWKWGSAGTCYPGEAGKAKAQRQAFAVGASRARQHGVRGRQKVAAAASRYMKKESAEG